MIEFMPLCKRVLMLGCALALPANVPNVQTRATQTARLETLIELTPLSKTKWVANLTQSLRQESEKNHSVADAVEADDSPTTTY